MHNSHCAYFVNFVHTIDIHGRDDGNFLVFNVSGQLPELQLQVNELLFAPQVTKK